METTNEHKFAAVDSVQWQWWAMNQNYDVCTWECSVWLSGILDDMKDGRKEKCKLAYPTCRYVGKLTFADLF